MKQKLLTEKQHEVLGKLEAVLKEAKENNIECFVPKFEYCTDNAAMIGSAGYYAFINNVGIADMTLAPKPNLSL